MNRSYASAFPNIVGFLCWQQSTETAEAKQDSATARLNSNSGSSAFDLLKPQPTLESPYIY